MIIWSINLLEPSLTNVYNVYIMVRKQLYLEEYQNKALKQRAKELNISEAELLRRALNNELKVSGQSRAANKKASLLQGLFDKFDQLAKEYPISKQYKFKRQELYEEDDRFGRWN